MDSLPDPGESTQFSLTEFQTQASLMTSCTLLWKDLSDHFLSLENNLMKKSEELMAKILALDEETKGSLRVLEERESSIDEVVSVAVEKVKKREAAAMDMDDDGVGDGEGSCGLCWSFSTTGALEGANFRAIGKLESLSEQQLVDCDHECDPAEPGSCDNGCNGGLMNSALEYTLKAGGLMRESDYPYTGKDNGTCKFDKSKIVAKVSNFSVVSLDKEQIAANLVKNDPLAVAKWLSMLLICRHMLFAITKLSLARHEVVDGDGLLSTLRSFCTKMNSEGFWRFVIARKKEMDSIGAQMPEAIADCVDPARFVLEAISEVFPVDKRVEKSERVNDLGWACVLILEALIPLVVDPVFGKSRLLVTPSMRKRAEKIAEAWKVSLDERGGIENVRTPDVHTFLQHLVTFGIVKKEDIDLYRKLVIGSAWRKQMPKLAVSLGLREKMPDMIEELISRGQQVDAVHFTFEVGLQDKFPPVPLLKDFLMDAKKAAGTISDTTGRSAHLAARKEQSALRAVIKCIEKYKLEAEFSPENLKKRLEQLEKTKISEKRKPVTVPANKRTRGNISGPMPPAKAGRSTNAYVSSFPAAPAFVRSPIHTQYPTGVPQYQPAPTMYSNNRSPPYMYSPEAASPPMASYSGIPVSYSHYGGYGNGVVPAYHQAYYR